jgi:SAM-dependent MidA family methyltransferase
MTKAERLVRARIREAGRITFAEFMELALYDPGGYYGSGRRPAHLGDYYTNPEAHPLFGALLALQVEQCWRLLGSPPRFVVAEPGAGDGTLARDILAYAQRLDPAFASALTYVAIDRAIPPAAPAMPGAQWLRSERFPLRDVTGCVISNELVDALPVHRVVMQGGRLCERYVALDGGLLAGEAREPSTPELAEMLARQGVRLEEGWEAEVGLAAARWMESVAQGVRRGYVITIDYGDLAERLHTPARKGGTLAAYFQHTPQSDPYARVGRQDLTAHANFTTLVDAGRRHGLEPVALVDQRSFLSALGAGHCIDALRGLGLSQRDYDANRMAMRDLLKPNGLGAFRVLVQAKRAPATGLAGLAGGDGETPAAWRERLGRLPVPLLTPAHLDLVAARYPHLAGTWELR